MSLIGPSAKFLAPAKKRLVIGVLQTRFSHLEFFAFCRVGPGNFTPSPSQIPDVILSHHPARAIA